MRKEANLPPGGGLPHKSDGGCSSSPYRVFWDGKSLHFSILVLLRALQKEFTKNAGTLTKQKFPSRVSFSLSHTHIGLAWGFNFNILTSIPITIIW